MITSGAAAPGVSGSRISNGEKIGNAVLGGLKARGGGLHIVVFAHRLAASIRNLRGFLVPPREGDLNVAESFMLMWHDPKSGDINGRLASFDLKSVAVGCLFVDLMSMNRIELLDSPGKLWGVNSSVFIRDETPTGNAACDLLLGTLVQGNSNVNNKALHQWLQDLYLGSGKYVAAILDGLISREILTRPEQQGSCLPTPALSAFPTMDSRYEEVLVNEMRAAVFENVTSPNKNTLAVLFMCKTADMFYCGHFVLRHAFYAKEVEMVKQFIKNRISEDAAGVEMQ